VFSVAKLKLADVEKHERAKLENHQQFASGKATFNDLPAENRTRLRYMSAHKYTNVQSAFDQ